MPTLIKSCVRECRAPGSCHGRRLALGAWTTNSRTGNEQLRALPQRLCAWAHRGRRSAS